jgi:citrate synthase
MEARDDVVDRIAPAEIRPGLEGVVLCETLVSDVDGAAGRYRYRSHDACELAQRRTVEDVWHLLIHGALPAGGERSAFTATLGERRALSPWLEEALPRLAGPEPMVALRSAFSLLSGHAGFCSSLDLWPAELRHQAVWSCAVLPTIVATLHRLQRGLPAVAPDPADDVATSFLHVLLGRRPPVEHARALGQYLILAADHGMAASTLALRAVMSTGADYGSAVTAAIGALGGPLHGGAPHRVLDMLDAIGSPERADAWLRSALDRDERLMGFGHRVYRTTDPRAVRLRAVALELGAERAALAMHVEERATALLATARPDRRLHVNVELYAAVVLDAIGVPRSLFAPVFALARMPGWSAHALEQAAENRLIRPLTAFAGGPLQLVPEVDR